MYLQAGRTAKITTLKQQLVMVKDLSLFFHEVKAEQP